MGLFGSVFWCSIQSQDVEKEGMEMSTYGPTRTLAAVTISERAALHHIDQHVCRQ